MVESALSPMATDEWALQRQRDEERRMATAQRRKGYHAGWYSLQAEAVPRPPVSPDRADRLPLSAKALEWVLSDMPGRRVAISALNDVFRPQGKPERESLARLVAQTCEIQRVPGEPAP